MFPLISYVVVQYFLQIAVVDSPPQSEFNERIRGFQNAGIQNAANILIQVQATTNPSDAHTLQLTPASTKISATNGDYIHINALQDSGQTVEYEVVDMTISFWGPP